MKRAAWAVLGVLLAATLAGAATFDRRTWPSLVGDEATYLMAAASLAWDHDLRYERRDYDRFFARWGVQPDGLILQRADGGKTLVFGKPVAYSLYLGPFARLAPSRGHGWPTHCCWRWRRSRRRGRCRGGWARRRRCGCRRSSSPR